MTGPALADTVLRRANDLSFGGSESLDPISANRFYEVNDLIYSRLIRQGDDGRPAPELAQTWTANDTATEWTLTLQPGVTFHDGSTFDAADVKFTLERIKDPALESPVTDVLGFIDGVDVVDPLTASIRLSTPHAGLPLLLMDYRVRILPEGAAEPFGIGTGPFKLDSYDPESSTILTANTAYWEGAPKLDRVEFTAIPDSEARNQAMLGGQIDYNGLTRDQEPLYAGNPDFTVASLRGNAVLRWEWRPGSTLFVVWQRDRYSEEVYGDNVGLRALSESFGEQGDNYLTLKMSYWIPVR
jgi:peptide/nickel transport system substrate-binding protein